MDVFKLMGTIAVDNSDANRGIDETTGKAREASSGMSGSFSKVTGVAATLGKGILAVGGTAAGLAGAIIGLSNSTGEWSEDMGKLKVAFDQHNFSAETATGVYRGFVGILGETDQSVEAANHLAQLCGSQEELSQWTNIAAGVYATFGDSLPLEGLTEAANETARVAQVTGPFADALNWANVSTEQFTAGLQGHDAAMQAFNASIAQGNTREDAFTAALQACSNEQERSQIVTSTMTALYGEAGQKYQEVNKDLIESRQAQADFNAAMGELGEAVRPAANALTEMGTALLQGVMPYIQQFADWVSSQLPAVQQVFGDVFGGVMQVIGPVADAVTNLFKSFSDGGNNVAGLQSQLAPFTDIILPAIQNAITAAQPFIDGLMSAFQNLATTVGNNLVPYFQAAWDMMQQVASVISSILTPVINTIVPIVMQMATMVINFVQQILAVVIPAMTNIYNTISQILAAIQPYVAAAMNFIMNIVQTVWPHIQSVIQNVMNIVQSVISTVMGVVQGIISTVLALIQGNWSGVWQGIQSIASSIWNGIKGVISGVIGAIQGVISGALSAIQAVWNGAWNTVKSVVSSAWNGITGAISNGINSAVNFVRGLPGRITSALGNLGGLLVSAGRDLIMGLVNGIKNAVGSAVNAVKNAVGSVISGAKNLLGIHSPSVVFREIGDYTMQGLQGGIEDETDATVKATTNAVSSVIDAASGLGFPSASAYVPTVPSSYGVDKPATDAVLARLDRLADMWADFMPRILAAQDRQVVLDSGALVGELAMPMDQQLGNISRRRGRGQ